MSVKPVTIVDVAEHLGLSKSTVSRALRGYRDIAASTRQRVTDAAETMGYTPSIYAQAIRTGSARSVGLVLRTDGEDAHKPFLSDFLDGVSRALSAMGWTLSVATAPNEAALLQRHLDMAAQKKVDGFIVPRTLVDDPRISLIRDLGLPYVLYGRNDQYPDQAWFDIDQEQCFAEALQRLCERGHRRIVYLDGPQQYYFSALRRQGVERAAAALGVEVERIGDVFSADRAYQLVLPVLQRPPAQRPTAVLCAVDRAAIGVYRAAQACAVLIGQDLSVIGYDGIPEGEYFTPPLSSYAVDNRAAGQAIASLLLRRLRGEPVEQLQQLGQARLLQRGSDAPAPLVAQHRATAF